MARRDAVVTEEVSLVKLDTASVLDAVLHSNVVKQAAASACAGVLSRSIMYPLDTVRAILQTQKRVSGVDSVAMLKGQIDQGGWRRLYKGYSLALTWTPPSLALYFVTYEAAKKHISIPSYPALAHFLSGLTAEAVAGIVWVPLDVVKQRMQVQLNVQYTGSPTEAVQAVLRHGGLRGFYKGYLTCLATYGPYTAIHFAIYEHLKASARLSYGILDGAPESLPPHAFLGCAAISSCAAAAITNPLDVIKTRLQVDASSSLSSVIRRLIFEDGPRGFSRGLAVRLCLTAPQTALALASYETFKRMLDVG